MPKIIVRQCRFTKQIFTDDQKFAQHLSTLRDNMEFKRKQRGLTKKRNSVFASMRNTCSNTTEIAQFIFDHWPVFINNAYASDSFNPPGGFYNKLPRLVNIKLDTTWSDRVSNSHYAPLSGGETNWHRDPNIVLGYPGWTGKITFSIKRSTNRHYSSEFFHRTGIFTGSGGGRHSDPCDHDRSSYEYSVHLFAADWPTMHEEQKKKTFKQALGFVLE